MVLKIRGEIMRTQVVRKIYMKHMHHLVKYIFVNRYCETFCVQIGITYEGVKFYNINKLTFIIGNQVQIPC